LAKSPKLDQLNWLIKPKPFLKNDPAVTYICIYISHILLDESNDASIREKSKQTFAVFLSDMFKDKEDEYRFSIINEMKQHDITWEILEAEWKYSTEKSHNKIVAHEAYYKHVLQDDSKFSQQYKSELLIGLWDFLSKQEQSAQAIVWSQNTEFLPMELRNTVLQTASEKISFDLKDEKSDKLCKILNKQIKQYNIVLSPNRLILRDIVIKANADKKNNFDEKYLNEIQQTLAKVDRETYEEFSQLYLPMVISRITEKEQHGSILKAVFCPKYADIFEQSYSLFYENGSPKQFDKSDNAALMFWLYADNKDLLIPKEVIVDWLASRIAKLKKDKYEIFLNGIKRKIDRKSEKMWQEIYSKVEKKRRSLLSRIFRWK